MLTNYPEIVYLVLAYIVVGSLCALFRLGERGTALLLIVAFWEVIVSLLTLATWPLWLVWRAGRFFARFCANLLDCEIHSDL